MVRPGAFSVCCALALMLRPAGLLAQQTRERLPSTSDAAVNDPPPLPPAIEQELLSVQYPTTGLPNTNVNTSVGGNRVAGQSHRRRNMGPPSVTQSPVPDSALSPPIAMKAPNVRRSPPVTTATPPTSAGASLRFIIP
jgi:hypothetical protein